MTGFLKVFGLLTVVLHCNGLNTRKEDGKFGNNDAVFRLKSARRFVYPQGSVIIGAPSYPNHLPEAEAILPGHTLIRPGLGMLKSAIKFPHRELEGGSGVYGNYDNIGIRYDGRNERVLYSGFRRSNSNDPIVLVLPSDLNSNKAKTKKDTQYQLLSKIIEDMLNTGNGKHRNSKTPLKNKYFTGKSRKSGQDKKKDNFLSFKLRGGLVFNNISNVIGNGLKSLNLKNLVKTKDKYLRKLVKTIASLRRYRNNDMKQNRKHFFDDKYEEKLYKRDDNQNKSDEKHSYRNSDEILSEISQEITLEPDTDLNKISIKPYQIDTITLNPSINTSEHRKQEWLLQAKDLGNHIKFSPQALDFDEFQPKIPDEEMEPIQSWWFYNQADYKELQEKRRHV